MAASATSSSEVRELFARIALSYDRLNHLLSLSVDKLWRARAAREIPPRGRVLDLCAGTLDLALAIHRSRPHARVLASDFCLEMLRLGRAKPGAATLTILAADALHLPFPDRSFAALTCAFGVRNFADLDRGLREARRVLQAGGRLVVVEFFKPATAWSRSLHRIYVRWVLPAVGRWVSGDPRAYRYLADSIGGFLSVEQFGATLRASGFDRVRAIELPSRVATLVIAELEA
jgi:ubiquinone/menaquinone biosynthesis methyltransferase